MTMTNERLVALKRMGLRGPALVLLALAVGAAVLWWTGQVTTERMQAELLGKAVEYAKSQGVPSGMGAHKLETVKACVEAGVKPETISTAKGIGGHPGGTAAVGRVVDLDLQTKVRGLCVCDNSVMPRSGGVPPAMTLIALAKYMVRRVWV